MKEIVLIEAPGVPGGWKKDFPSFGRSSSDGGILLKRKFFGETLDFHVDVVVGILVVGLDTACCKQKRYDAISNGCKVCCHWDGGCSNLPAVMNFTLPLTGNVSRCLSLSSAECTDSSAPRCSDNLCVAVFFQEVMLKLNGLYDAREDSVQSRRLFLLQPSSTR